MGEKVVEKALSRVSQTAWRIALPEHCVKATEINTVAVLRVHEASAQPALAPYRQHLTGIAGSSTLATGNPSFGKAPSKPAWVLAGTRNAPHITPRRRGPSETDVASKGEVGAAFRF